MNAETRFTEQCHAYFDGGLAPGQEAELFDELLSHPEYRPIFEKLQKVHFALQQFAEVEPSVDFEHRLMKAVAEENGEKYTVTPFVAPRRRTRWMPIQAAAAVLMLLGAGLAFHFQPWNAGNTASRQMLSDAIQAPEAPAPERANGNVPLVQTDKAAKSMNEATAQQPSGGAASGNQLAARQAGTARPASGKTVEVASALAPEVHNVSDVQLEKDLADAWNGIDEANRQMGQVEQETSWAGSSATLNFQE